MNAIINSTDTEDIHVRNEIWKCYVMLCSVVKERMSN